ncbi:hypothetical protein IJ732_00965, partial [bacterium]|nr:hypothetical protein [bacterium]
MNKLQTRAGGGALGSKSSEDALLGSQNCGALGLKVNEDALLGLESLSSPSLRGFEEPVAIPNALNTCHSETPKAGSESV